MDGKPRRFSVVMPTYNRILLLRQALDSVLNQDYPAGGFEVIVVNDGSTDGTGEYLKSIAGGGGKADVKVINSARNRGVACSRNAGIKNASGEIIASIDDDCVAEKDWLRTLDGVYSSKPELMSVGVRLVNAHENNLFSRYVHAFHVYGMNTGHMPGDSMRDIMENLRPPEREGFVHGCGAGHSSYRRIVFDELGFFDEGLRSAEDVEFNLRFQGRYGRGRMYYTPAAGVRHYYVTTYFGLARQFFNYGRGGRRFREIRAGLTRGKPFWYSSVYTLKFVAAICLHLKRNALELAAFAFVAATAQLSLLAGEAYEATRGPPTPRPESP